MALQATLVLAATTPPVLWSAGGLDAGNGGAGQAGHVAVDTAGNVVVVSGPSGGRLLTTTSYTPDGLLRWRRSEAPSSGTYLADWVAAAPGGDVVVLGHNQDSSGRAVTHTVLRYAADGTLRWRLDPPGRLFGLARLVVDGAGNTYVGVNGQVDKYNSAGVLQWSQTLTAGIAHSLALSPDGADVVLVGGGASWATAVIDTATGARRWALAAAEGLGGSDVVVDATRVYVAGQGITGASTPAIAYHFTVIAYDRATGARLWRSDKRPADGSSGAALRIARAGDGSLVATGQILRGFLDWYTVAFETSGATRWEAVRDGGLNTDEIPAAVLTLADGTTVVSGRGGPNLPGGYIPGVTVGYGPGGSLLWQAFSPMSTVWATALPSGDVCAAGGYDALVTCWRLGAPATPPAAPTNLTLRAITGAVVATWVDNAADEASYAVERAEFTGTTFTPFATIATVPANTVSYADTTRPSGRELSYRVRATNAGGDSPYSNTANIQIFSTNTPPTAVVTATPAWGVAPLPVVFDGSASTDLGGSVVAWAWTFGDGTTGTGATTTHVYGTPGTYVATLQVTDNGNLSNTATVTIVVTAPAVPSAPAGLTAAALSRSAIRLNWSNGSVAQTAVLIERCTGSGCTNFAQVATATGTATTFTDTGRASRTTYTYRVRARNAAGTSPYSNSASARTLR